MTCNNLLTPQSIITAHSTPELFSYGFHFVKQVHLQTLRMIPIFLHYLNTPYQPHMQNFKHFLWVMHFLHYHLKINLFLRLTKNKCFFTGPLRSCPRGRCLVSLPMVEAAGPILHV